MVCTLLLSCCNHQPCWCLRLNAVGFGASYLSVLRGLQLQCSESAGRG